MYMYILIIFAVLVLYAKYDIKLFVMNDPNCVESDVKPHQSIKPSMTSVHF